MINSDSIQMYRDLKILTDFPTAYKSCGIEHKLFGFLGSDEKITVFDWATLAANEVETTFQKNKTPIIVGGTGFFINTLINGISPIPEISQKVRQNASMLAKNNYDELCEHIYSHDPRLEAAIPRSKHRQMLRAYEVMLTTGKSILHFHETARTKFIQEVFYDFSIMVPNREKLYSRVSDRVDSMMKNGAIDEVQASLSALGIDRSCLFQELTAQYPIFRAIGAKEIIEYLNGKCAYDTMVELIKKNTRHYAKRQITWFQNQVRETEKIKIQWIND
jgi:tRNA dimethylallyltransferase